MARILLEVAKTLKKGLDKRKKELAAKKKLKKKPTKSPAEKKANAKANKQGHGTRRRKIDKVLRDANSKKRKKS